MGKLNRRILSYCYARGDSFYNGCLGGSYERACALGKIISLKVYSHNDSAAYRSVRLNALRVDHRVRVRNKNFVKIFLHSGVYKGNSFFGFRKINLGQNYAKGRGVRADLRVCRLPIVRLACKLVASNDRPFLRVNLGKVGKKYVRALKASFVHSKKSFQNDFIQFGSKPSNIV